MLHSHTHIYVYSKVHNLFVLNKSITETGIKGLNLEQSHNVTMTVSLYFLYLIATDKYLKKLVDCTL